MNLMSDAPWRVLARKRVQCVGLGVLMMIMSLSRKNRVKLIGDISVYG